MKGAQVQANGSIDADVGGDLTVASVQDTSRIDGKSKGGSIGLSVGLDGSGDPSSDTPSAGGTALNGSVSYGKEKGRKAWVEEQSGLIAKGDVDVTVGGHTQLDGAVIASTEGDVALDTETFDYTDIQDYDNYKNVNGSISGSIGIGGDDSTDTSTPDLLDQIAALPTIEGSYEASEKEQITRATVAAPNGDATITIRANPGQGIEGLNNALEKAQEITKDKKTKVKVYVSGESLAEVVSGFQGTQNLINSIGESLQAVKDVLLPENKDDFINSIPEPGSGDEIGTVPQSGEDALRQVVIAAGSISEDEAIGALKHYQLLLVMGVAPEDAWGQTIELVANGIAPSITTTDNGDAEIILANSRGGRPRSGRNALTPAQQAQSSVNQIQIRSLETQITAITGRSGYSVLRDPHAPYTNQEVRFVEGTLRQVQSVQRLQNELMVRDPSFQPNQINVASARHDARALTRELFNGTNSKISQRQNRHIKGRPEWVKEGQKGYFDNINQAQIVLNAARNGNVEFLGSNSQGQPVVRFNGVTGYNNNLGSGFFNQPTNVFVIKGTTTVSIFPTSPSWVRK